MPHKEALIKLSLEKAEQAIKSAKDNIKLNNLETAQNRIYYSIFYAVCALAYKNGFSTAKHRQLMGWFNKKFIYEDKIFNENMLEIYAETFNYRMKFDYEFTFKTNKKEVENSLNEALFFVNEIKKYLSHQQ